MKLKVKKYLLSIDKQTWVEVEKYSKKNDLMVSQIIRKAIRNFLNI